MVCPGHCPEKKPDPLAYRVPGFLRPSIASLKKIREISHILFESPFFEEQTNPLEVEY
jgi:hypothetical protein